MKSPGLVIAILSCIATSSLGSVCYDDWCFETSRACHWRTPDSPDDVGTSFKLYTRDNQNTGDAIDHENAATITASHFQADRDTKFLIHGYTDSMGGASWIEMKNTFLQNYDVNVVMVDWNPGASRGYTQSRANTRVVGREVAALIQAFHTLKYAALSSMHIIGHSLGAHTGGYAGEACGGMIGRISGMDPAGPEFGGDLEPECRLDPTDALFVDVLHTDGDIIALGGAGLMDELGHQDFYPNGGMDMPGCPFLSVTCDHSRAVEYYIESIWNPCSFMAKQKAETWEDIDNGSAQNCDDTVCPQMGYRADKADGEGAFYLTTNGDEPYCQG
ncbi:pancreatic lipase-related protein 2-like [Diadema setosum]|uniref:pancreatic lipase-related protein 2-like n=1 Tax=Diadema setosum TaxID=31175 RepID=UPI003B3AFD70